MKLGEFYKKAIKKGIEEDPRGVQEVEAELKKRAKAFEKLSEKEKEYFDQESLVNPYADTRVLHGDQGTLIKDLFVGIDIGVGELLLADRLRQSGRNIDLIVAHHPEGRAQAKLFEVLKMQADIIAAYGVPINIADTLLEERSGEVERRLMPLNHNRVVDAARVLDIPFLCIHTPSDNCVAGYLQKTFDEKKPESLSDVIDLLMEISEYRYLRTEQNGPKILLGSKEKRSGRVFVDMTGGTAGNKKAYEKLSQAGVGTIVAMHMSEEHRKEAKKHMLNVVIAGHIGSDTLGLNILLDEIEKEEPLNIIECSGFRRIRRNN